MVTVKALESEFQSVPSLLLGVLFQVCYLPINI